MDVKHSKCELGQLVLVWTQEFHHYMVAVNKFRQLAAEMDHGIEMFNLIT